MLINLSPLYQFRDYRLLYFGQFISIFGSMLVYVALPYQIYQLTHSTLAVGCIGIVELIPLLAASLYGGALADLLDRKKLLLSTELGLALISGLLMVNASVATPHVWFIFVLAGLGSAMNGLHRPTLEAITPMLVPRAAIPAVAALTSFKYGVNMVAAPALTGFLIAKWGLPMIYTIDSLSFVASVMAIVLIRTPLHIERAAESIMRSIKQGFHYAASRQELIGTYIVDIVAMIFGMPMALFPAISEHLGGVTVLGWLYAAPAVGSLIASIFSGWANKIKRHGAAVAIAATVWGLAIIGFGFSNHILFALLFLIIAGGADAVSGLFRSTMWNQTIPSHLRGRLAGIEMMSYMSGPLLGNAEAGLVAAAFGTAFSVVSGGVLCIAGVVISCYLLPKFWRYSSSELPNELDTSQQQTR